MRQESKGPSGPSPRLKIISRSNVERNEALLAPLPFHPQKEILDSVDDLYFTARQLVGDPGLAESFVLETCHLAWRSWPSLRSAFSFKAWLFSILHHALRKHEFRADRHWKDLSLENCLLRDHACDTGDPSGTVPIPGAPTVSKTFDDLPGPLKETVILVDLEQFTLHEVSMILAVPLGTVASRLYRAHRGLQDPHLPARAPDFRPSPTPESRCRWTRRLSLLGRSTEDPVMNHLRECGRCRSFLDREQETSEWTRAQVQRERAPRSLRERVRHLLSTRIGPQSKSIWAGIPWPWVVVVTVLITAVALFLSLGQVGAKQILDQVCRDHVAFAVDAYRAEFPSSSMEEVEAWIREHLQLAAQLPRLAGSELLGARLSPEEGRNGGIVFFDLGPLRPPPTNVVSLHLFEARGEDWSILTTVDSPGPHRMGRIDHRGVNVWVWNRLGITYLLASQLEDEELQGMVTPF